MVPQLLGFGHGARGTEREWEGGWGGALEEEREREALMLKVSHGLGGRYGPGRGISGLGKWARRSDGDRLRGRGMRGSEKGFGLQSEELRVGEQRVGLQGGGMGLTTPPPRQHLEEALGLRAAREGENPARTSEGKEAWGTEEDPGEEEEEEAAPAVSPSPSPSPSPTPEDAITYICE